jgi:site-specific DNA recombinase
MQAFSPDMDKIFASTARERLRLENGGYRRDQLRAFPVRRGR